jgi:hypothetical protein
MASVTLFESFSHLPALKINDPNTSEVYFNRNEIRLLNLSIPLHRPTEEARASRLPSSFDGNDDEIF